MSKITSKTKILNRESRISKIDEIQCKHCNAMNKDREIEMVIKLKQTKRVTKRWLRKNSEYKTKDIIKIITWDCDFCQQENHNYIEDFDWQKYSFDSSYKEEIE